MIEIEGPETIFHDDAKRLLARINELERSGARKQSIQRATMLLQMCLEELDAAFANLR